MLAVRCPACLKRNIRRLALLASLSAAIAFATATAVSAAPASATIGGIERVHRSVVLTGLIDWIDGVSPRLEARGPLSLSVVSTDRQDAPRRMLLLTSTPSTPVETVKLPVTEEARSWPWVNCASGSR
jgi:hypothetical protein